MQLDGAATLVLTFSVPLQPDQDFSRSVHLVDKKSGKVDGAWELAPNLKELRLRHLEPKRELIVSVDPTLTALNKATLDKPFEKTLTTRDIAPSVGFASRGSLLPGNVIAGLPVMALNVDNVDVNFFRIKPESLSAFVSQWEYRNSLSNWESDELLKMADLVYSGRFDLNPARNTREKLLLPLSDIKPLQQRGVYVAVMNPAGHYSYSNAATLFTLSDIGVSAHRYHNRLDVFTQSLETAPPSLVSMSSCSTPKGRPWRRRKAIARATSPCKPIKKPRCCWRAKRDRPRCSTSNCRRWIWRSSPLPARQASANSSLCLAHGISIVRAKR